MRCMCDVCAAYEELVAASKQFRRSRGQKSTRLGLVALTVGPVHIRMRASKERASEGSVCGCASAATLINSAKSNNVENRCQNYKMPYQIRNTVIKRPAQILKHRTFSASPLKIQNGLCPAVKGGSKHMKDAPLHCCRRPHAGKQVQWESQMAQAMREAQVIRRYGQGRSGSTIQWTLQGLHEEFICITAAYLPDQCSAEPVG